MPSRRGSRQSRVFANFAGPSNAGERERVVSRNVEINLNGAPGVVCQLADYAQGTDETIEVTVVPRRRPGKLIVRVEEDESREEGRRHRHHQSRGRNEENVAPGNNQNDDDDEDVDDDTESLRVNTGRKNTPATAKRKTGARKPSCTEEQNAPSKYTSCAGPSHPAHLPLPPPPPGPAATGHDSTAFRRLSPFDFARRLSDRVPWKSSSRAANAQPADREKARDTGNHHHHRRSIRARSSANPSPATESFDTSTPSSYLDDFVHRCHSCGKPRCEYIQNERPVREGEKAKPSLCSSCQSKLSSSRHKILGPGGKDLSQKYWCDVCGFVRSTRYHTANGFPDDNSRGPKEANMCSWCIRAEKRRGADNEKGRQPDDTQVKVTVWPDAIALAVKLGRRLTVKYVQKKNTTRLNQTVGQPAPAPPVAVSTSASASYRSSSYGSYLAPPPAPPRHRYRRSQHDDNMDTDDEEDNAYHAHTKGINTASTTHAPSFSNASIRSQKGPPTSAPMPPPVFPEAPVAPPQRVSTPRPTPLAHLEDAAPSSPEDGNGGGFINNSSAFWAQVGDDPMLRTCFGQDPREAAARRARLAGDYRGPSVRDEDDDDDDDYTSYIAQGVAGLNLDFTGPRIVELASDEE